MYFLHDIQQKSLKWLQCGSSSDSMRLARHHLANQALTWSGRFFTVNSIGCLLTQTLRSEPKRAEQSSAETIYESRGNLVVTASIAGH